MSTELKRLVDDADSAFTRELLASAVDDLPEPSAKRRARSALGVSALGLGALATASAVGASSAPVGANAGGAAVGLGGVALKWSGALALVLAAGTGTIAYVARDQPQPRRNLEAPVAARLKPTAYAPAPQPSASASAIDALLSAQPPQMKTAPAPRVPATLPSAAPALADEIGAMDAARRALSHGDLAPLERYLSKYPHGVFREQGLALRIRALNRAGRSAQARAEARAFLNAYPRSVEASSMRRLLDD